MTIDRLIRVFAGTFILLSLALGVEGSPIFVSRWWLAFTAFVGFNLFQYGFTNFCPLGWMLKKAGVRESKVACA
ncbi:MAG: YgaP family membrane protein [Burkholderiaceae bacterium]